MTQVTSAEVMAEKSSDSETKTRALRTPLDNFIWRIAERVGGNKAVEVQRFIKFGMIGTLGAIIDLGLSNLLYATVLPPDPNMPFNVPIVVTISFTAAVLNNFTWNRFWTYPDSRSRSIRRQLSQFALVSISGWLARTTWISLSYVGLGGLAANVLQNINADTTITAETANTIGANIAMLIGIFVIMIWNFFANRYWTYNDVDSKKAKNT